MENPSDGLLWFKRLLLQHSVPDLCVKFRGSWNYGPPGETTLKHTLPYWPCRGSFRCEVLGSEIIYLEVLCRVAVLNAVALGPSPGLQPFAVWHLFIFNHSLLNEKLLCHLAGFSDQGLLNTHSSWVAASAPWNVTCARVEERGTEGGAGRTRHEGIWPIRAIRAEKQGLVSFFSVLQLPQRADYFGSFFWIHNVLTSLRIAAPFHPV